jgi:hypothetical protein
MLDQDRNPVQRLVTCTAIGAFAGMALVAWLMFFDVSSIGTLAASASDNSVFSKLVVGGSLLKGGLVGFAVGLASCAGGQRRERSATAGPVANPAVS